MYPYLGDFPTGQTIYIPFHTFDSNDPSASVTLTGLAVTDIEVYKNGSVTQRASDAGYTLLDTDGIDFDGITGIHGISIDTSDNTDAGFWAAGNDYWVIISSVTVDAATINFIAATFSIDNRGLLRPTTAQRTLDVTATGAAGIDWGNIENPTTVVDLAGTDINLVDTTTTNTDMRGTDSALLAASAPTNFGDLSITATTGRVDVAAIAGTAQTANDNGADINEILTDTGTTLPAILGTPTDFGSGTSTLAANLQDIADNGTATYDRSTDSLQAIRDRGDAAWTTGSGTGLTALASGTAQGGTASTIQLAAGETFGDDILNGSVVKITSGTGAGQSRVITDYTGATDTASVTPDWITNPDATSVYEVVEGSSNLSAISNDAQSVTDLKDFADAGYDPATNKVQGVVLVDTTTTNTDMRGTDSALLAASAPTNFGDLSITATTGRVDVASIAGTAQTANDNGADINAILVDTAEIGTAGAGLTAVPWNAAWDAEVQSECTDALNAYDPPTKAENDALLTTALTESYNTDGSAPTVTQALMGIYQMLTEKAVSGTTVTVKKLDGSTTAMTLTLDDGTSPTSITRAS